MANDKPTAVVRVVSLDLTPEQKVILRGEIAVWLCGYRDDLERPERLKDPDRTRRVAAAFERLITAIEQGRLELPDEEARLALEQAADGFDEGTEFPETLVIHNAQRALLALLEQGAEDSYESTPAEEPWTTREDDLAMESAVLQRVLDAHPARLTEAELEREVAGEKSPFGTRDAVARAVRDLSGVGLLHSLDGFVTPTRAALRNEQLLDR